MASASREGSDEPVCVSSFARAFAARIPKSRDVDEGSVENLDL